jgi:MFS family permease
MHTDFSQPSPSPDPAPVAGGGSLAGERAVDLQVGMAMIAVGFFVASMGAVVAILAAEFAVAPESLSWVGSTFGLGLLVVAATGRWLLGRGPRVALTGSAVTFTVGTLLVALSPDLGAVFAGAILEGVGAAVMVLVAPVMLITNADVRLTRVNAIASLIGIAASPLIGAIAGTGTSGRLGLLVLVPVQVALLWLLAASRRPRRARVGNASGTAATAPTGAASTDAAPAEKRTRVRPATAARRWLAIVMSVSVEFCYVVWGVSRLLAAGLDMTVAAMLGIAFPIGMTLGRLAGPWLIRRLPAVPFGAAVAITGTLLVALTESWPSVAAGLMVAGIGVATLYPVTLAELMAVPGLQPSHAASLGALASGTAIVLAPVGLAALAGVIDLRLAFLIPIPLLVALVVLHGRPARTRREPTFFEAEA